MTGMLRYPNCSQVEKPVSVCRGWKVNQLCRELRQCEGGVGLFSWVLGVGGVRSLSWVTTH